MAWIPFSSARRVMTVAYIDLAEDENKVKVVMKGAPEEIIKRCSQSYDSFGNEGPIDEAQTLSQIEEQVILFDQGSGPQGLKAISIAQKFVDLADFNPDSRSFEDPEARESLESDLCYIATLGMSDPLRDNVGETIEAMNSTQTNVRLLSGDHKLAVLATAVQLEMKESIEDQSDVMSGEDLLREL